MPENSEGKIIRKRWDEIPKTSSEELARMEAIPDEAIDLSDIPERVPGGRLIRDEHGRLPKRSSIVRDAVISAMAEREMTPDALWKEAKTRCPTLSETAIGEFLKGRRSIGVDDLEAIMAALDLTIAPSRVGS